MSKSLIFALFLFLGEWCEWIAHFAQIKWTIWANISGRSPKMSDQERFAQVSQRKWAIVSESLRSLTKNERMSESLIFLSESLIRSFLDKKRAIRSEIKWAKSQPWKNITISFWNKHHRVDLNYACWLKTQTSPPIQNLYWLTWVATSTVTRLYSVQGSNPAYLTVF